MTSKNDESKEIITKLKPYNVTLNDKIDFILNDYELQTIKHIQNFRNDPGYFQKNRLKGACLMLKRSKKEDVAEELSELEYNDFKWDGKYFISPGLCLAANELAGIYNSGTQKDADLKKICDKYLNVSNDYNYFIYHELEGDDAFLITRFLVNENDPSRTFRQVLKEKTYKYIGVSQLSEDNKVIIFSRIGEKDAYLSIEDYKKVVSIYKKLDHKETFSLDPIYLVEAMEYQLFPVRSPYIYQIFKKLAKEKKYVDNGVSFLDFTKEVYKYMPIKSQNELLLEMTAEFFDLNTEKLRYQEKIIPMEKLRKISFDVEFKYFVIDKEKDLEDLNKLLNEFKNVEFITYKEFIAPFKNSHVKDYLTSPDRLSVLKKLTDNSVISSAGLKNN